jgi:hypothetical protein
MRISGRSLRLLAIVTLASFTVLNIPASPRVSAAPVVNRVSPLAINVVFIGLDSNQINPNYLVWNGSSKNLPSEIPNVVSDGFNTNLTGVMFKPEYQVFFAPSNFKQDLLSYMTSIQRQGRGPDPWFMYYTPDPNNPDYLISNTVSIDYVAYDANFVEEWLWNHLPSIGVRTDSSWTIIVSNLPELPSISFSEAQRFLKVAGTGKPPAPPSTKPHYYSTSVTDSDLGYTFPKRDFMKAWGGHHRMWFVDLSAGPVYLQNTNTQWDDLPLQVVVGDNNIDLTSDFGKNWLTEYAADYIFDATYSFVARNFLYYPRYFSEYQIDIHIFDDRSDSEKSQVPIQKTISQFNIVTALQDLVPYSNVTVNLQIQNTTQELHSLIESNYKYTDSWIYGNQFLTPLRYGVVDLRPVYKYLLDNFNEFELKIPGGSPPRKIIPVFAFAFSGDTTFTYTSKWYIADKDFDTGAELGFAQEECVIVGLNQYEFNLGEAPSPPQPGKGRGFTQTIIHELGHEFGLTHPHDTNTLGDFFFSPMGYYTNNIQFGISDKDSIQRAHVDGLYLQTQAILVNDPETSSNSGLIDQARSKLMQVDSDYAKMNYGDAIRPALAALQLAKEAAAVISPLSNSTSTTTSQATNSGNYSFGNNMFAYIIAGIAVGIVLGFAIPMLLKRRKPTG